MVSACCSFWIYHCDVCCVVTSLPAKFRQPCAGMQSLSQLSRCLGTVSNIAFVWKGTNLVLHGGRLVCAENCEPLTSEQLQMYSKSCWGHLMFVNMQ